MRRSSLLFVALVACVVLAGCSDGARLRREALAVPVPEGGDRTYIHSPSALHVGEQAEAGIVRYDYAPDTDRARLADEERKLLADAGWLITYDRDTDDDPPEADHPPAHFFQAQLEGKEVSITIARWAAEGGGCCVDTEDPARPLSLQVVLVFTPAPTTEPTAAAGDM